MAERHTGAALTVTSSQFQIVAIVLFSLALLSVFIRILLKIQQSRYFRLDDTMLFLSTMCFVAGTGLILHDTPTQNNLTLLNSILTLLWTTTFFAKFSLLAFFRSVVVNTNSRGMFWFFEITVGICVVGWVYVLVMSFIVGLESTSDIGLTYIGTVLDVLSDVMIVSIPILILVLRYPYPPIRQVFTLVAFVSFFVLHTTTSILRSCKPSEVSWSLFWLYISTSLCILTVFMTSYRNFCNLRAEEEEEAKRSKLKQTIYHARNNSKFGSLGSLGKITVTALPEVPKKSWRGLKYFVSRRDKDDEQVVFERCESGFGWLEKNWEENSKSPASYREMGLCYNHAMNMSGDTFV